MRATGACLASVVAVLSAALDAVAVGQGPPPVFPAASEIVQLDVVVTGRDRQPLPGLRREDFQVLEDGEPQPISHFAVGTAAKPAPSSFPDETTAAEETAAPRSRRPAPSTGRWIVLLFDDLHIGPGHLSAAKRDAVRFVQEQVGPADQVALVTTSGARGLFQPLTRDREAVVRTIERVSMQDRSARTRFARPYISEQQAEQIDRFGESASAGNDAFDLAVAQFSREYLIRAEVAVPMVRERVRDILSEVSRSTRASLSMLETTVRSLGTLPGRKLVVLMSEGFFLARGTSYQSNYDLRRITDAATRAGVVVYSLDVGGLTVPTPAGDISESGPLDLQKRTDVDRFSDENRREAMRAVAEDTGGLAVYNRNDVGRGLQKILADTETYYLLAYVPSTGRPAGRFRRIEVRLPGRKGLTARTRHGYFEAASPSPTKEARSSSPDAALDAFRERVREALVSVAPLSGLPVLLAADFVDLPDTGPTVAVNVGVDTGSDPNRPVQIVGVVTREDGETVQQYTGSLPIAPSAIETPRRLLRQIPLLPGWYRVRVAALGPLPRETGSASEWVEVPDLSSRRLAISSLLLSAVPRQDAASRRQSREGAASDSAPWRTFAPGSELDVVLFAYNASAGEAGAIDLSLSFLLRASGRLIHEFQPRPMRPIESGAPQRVPGGARLSLAGLPRGEYELRAVVEDRHAGTRAERGARFVVD
jgi:VWFA-related protein